MTRPALTAALFLAGLIGLVLFGPRAPGQLILLGVCYLAIWAVFQRDIVRKLFGPVFAYELTRLGRKRATFMTRFLYVAVIGLFFAYWFFLWSQSVLIRTGSTSVSGAKAAEFADQFFVAYALIQIGAIYVLAPAFVAGTVAQEKERKTLEFLLATDLSGAEIVFGKAAARLLTVLQFVVAGLGVIVFLQLFGGIDPDLLLASTAASALTAFGVTALGLYHSVRCRRAREAITATMLMLGLYVFVSYIVSNLIHFALPRYLSFSPLTLFGVTVGPAEVLSVVTDLTDAFGAGNPLLIISDMGMRGAFTKALFDAALRDYALFWGILSTFWLSYAVLRLRPVALSQAEGAPARGRGRAERAAPTRPAVGDDPIAWKEVFAEPRVRRRGRGVGQLLIIIAIFAIPAFIAGLCFMPELPIIRDFVERDTRPYQERIEAFRSGISAWVRGATGVVAFIALVACAVRGAGAVAGEKDRDTWVTLSSVPLSPWEIARGKWLGAALAPRRMYALLIAVWAFGLATNAADPPMILLTATYLAVYASGFAWLGVWCSLKAKSALGATTRALFASLFFLGGFWLVVLVTCTLPMGLLNLRSDRGLDSIMDEGGVLLLSLTPPVMLGILPTPPWETLRNGPFRASLTAIGPVMPLFGVLAWLMIGWGFAKRSHLGMARELNRLDRLPRTPPEKDNPPPSTRHPEPISPA